MASSSDDANDHSKPIFPASDWESDANTNNLNDTEASEARSIRSFLIKQTFITSTVQFLVSLTFFQCVPFFHIIHKTIHLFSPKQMKMRKLKNHSLKHSKIYQTSTQHHLHRHPPLNNSPYTNYYLVEELPLNSNSPPKSRMKNNEGKKLSKNLKKRPKPPASLRRIHPRLDVCLMILIQE